MRCLRHFHSARGDLFRHEGHRRFPSQGLRRHVRRNNNKPAEAQIKGAGPSAHLRGHQLWNGILLGTGTPFALNLADIHRTPALLGLSLSTEPGGPAIPD